MSRTIVSSMFVAALCSASACVEETSAPAEEQPTEDHPVDRDEKSAERTSAPNTPTLLRAAQVDSLYVRAGTPTALELAVPSRAGFDAASQRTTSPTLNVGRFIARVPGGRQESLSAEQLIGTRRVDYTFDRAGAGVIMLCLGPDGADASDAWQRVTYCSKTLYRIADAHGNFPDEYEDPGVMTKAALPIEVLPIMSPFFVRPGNDFAVRVYQFGQASKGSRVVAVRPDGTVDEQTSNNIGLALFRITAPGRWVVRLEGEHEGREVIGELVFDVETDGQKGPLR